MAGSRRLTAAACRMRSSARSAQIAGAPISAIAAGRTDAGAHATLQVVHFDTDARAPRQRMGARDKRALAAGDRRALGAAGRT